MNGNLPVDQLRALHMPTDPGWWPPAPGWWILAVFIIAVSAGLVWYWYSGHRANRWRRAALLELSAIRALPSGSATEVSTQLQACTKLLRRVALALYPQEHVASLVGEAWLRKLDEISRGNEFTQGDGRYVADSVFQQPERLPIDTQSLLDLVERTIHAVNVRRQHA
ncbi:MAG: DUF4381 domain-containing protein [Pseudomonadota bacterium]